MAFGINIVKGVAVKIYNGLVHINVGSTTITGVGDKLSDGAKVVTKITGATTGAAGGGGNYYINAEIGLFTRLR